MKYWYVDLRRERMKNNLIMRHKVIQFIRNFLDKENFVEIYEILDKDFPFYQSSYLQIMTRELAEIIKNDAQNLARKTKIEL